MTQELNPRAAAVLDAVVRDYIRTGQGRDELLATVQQAQGAEWLEAAFFGPMTVPSYDELSERQQWWRDHMDTDVAPLLEQMDFPILFVLGANDVLIPSELVETRVESILKDSDHADFAVEIFPEATHNVVAVAPADCGICVPDKITGIGPSRPWFASGYLDTVADWVTQRVETAD